MIPGEYRLKKDAINCNKNRSLHTLRVSNTGDRPIQVGSHFHFFEANRYLSFPRQEAIGMRLNIPSGTAVRFEPGEEKEIELVALGGKQKVYGLNNLTNGTYENKEILTQKALDQGFKGGQ